MPSSRLLSYSPKTSQASRPLGREGLKSSLLGMRKISTQTYRALKVSGKACAQYVKAVWGGCVQSLAVIHKPFLSHSQLWKNEQYYPVLYTNCIQLFDRLVGNFTSVNQRFCTVYTGPIMTTTKYINRRGIV